MTSVLRVIGNSISFILSLVLALWFFRTNPALSILFLLASIDNYEDVYEIVTRRHLIPEYLVPLDIVFEIVVLVFGLYILMLGYTYWLYFETPFAILLISSGFSVVFSSTKDIIKDIQRLRGAYNVIPTLQIRKDKIKYARIKKN